MVSTFVEKVGAFQAQAEQIITERKNLSEEEIMDNFLDHINEFKRMMSSVIGNLGDLINALAVEMASMTELKDLAELHEHALTTYELSRTLLNDMRNCSFKIRSAIQSEIKKMDVLCDDMKEVLDDLKNLSTGSTELKSLLSSLF